jgi:hypothetical protein
MAMIDQRRANNHDDGADERRRNGKSIRHRSTSGQRPPCQFRGEDADGGICEIVEEPEGTAAHEQHHQ